MRWLWRLLVLLVFLGLIRTLFIPQTQVFIAWPEGQPWVENVKYQMREWQRMAQDIPAGIEVQVRRLLRDFNPKDNAKEV